MYAQIWPVSGQEFVRDRHFKFVLFIQTEQQHIRYRHDLIVNSLRPKTHIYVGNLTIIGSDNSLSPPRRQAIIWTNARILIIGPFGSNLSGFVVGIEAFSFKKMHLKMPYAKWRPSYLGLNV